MNWDFLTEQKNVSDVADENTQLELIKNNIGSYLWQYKPEFSDEYGVDDNEHIGILAQELLKVPGLDSAVVRDSNGIYKVKTDYVALATLGLVAALTRKVAALEEEIENGADKQKVLEDIPATPEQDTSTGEEVAGVYAEPTEESVQPYMEPVEAEQSV